MRPEMPVTELPQIPMETKPSTARKLEHEAEELREELYDVQADLMETARQTMQSVGETVEDAVQKVKELAAEYPLATGLSGIGAGWLLHSLLRRPDPEEERSSWLRPSIPSTLLGLGLGWKAAQMERQVRAASVSAKGKAKDVKHQAEATVHDAMQAVKEKGEEALQAVRDKGDQMQKLMHEHPVLFGLAAAGAGVFAHLLRPKPASEKKIALRVLKELQKQGLTER